MEYKENIDACWTNSKREGLYMERDALERWVLLLPVPLTAELETIKNL
ncbi:MAG: hypothetical protein GY790_22695 [Bacteroidetes bacterium]|nr:hypothetical protein [Bacteroidota bacterium]